MLFFCFSKIAILSLKIFETKVKLILKLANRLFHTPFKFLKFVILKIKFKY